MQIEIPDELAAAVAEIAEKTGQDVESLAAEMVTEAIKMRRVPGILFADGATGRRARVGGTGIEVFEVIDRYEGVGRDRFRLQELFHWLEPRQIQMALSFYEAFPEDIKPYLLTEEEEQAAIEKLWREIPQTNPNWPGHRAGRVDLPPRQSETRREALRCGLRSTRISHLTLRSLADGSALISSAFTTSVARAGQMKNSWHEPPRNVAASSLGMDETSSD